MILRWLYGDIHDPQLKLSQRDRRHVWHLAKRLPEARRHTSKIGLAVRIMFGLLAGAIVAFGPKLFGSKYALIAFLVFLLGFSVVATVLNRMAWKPLLNRALAVMRYNECGNCGYSLQGHRDGKRPCPECGVIPMSLQCPHCRAWKPQMLGNPEICRFCGGWLKPSTTESEVSANDKR